METGTATAEAAAGKKKGRLWKWVKRIVVGLVILVVAAGLAGTAYQAIATTRDERRVSARRTVGGAGCRVSRCIAEFELHLGDRPLVVLTAGNQQDLKNFPKGISAEEMKAARKVWIEDLQVREARLSTSGKQIIVPDSTHMIPME